MGGVYLMLAELVLNLLRLQRRRCDPPPHAPSSSFVDDRFVLRPRAVRNVNVHGYYRQEIPADKGKPEIPAHHRYT